MFPQYSSYAKCYDAKTCCLCLTTTLHLFARTCPVKVLTAHLLITPFSYIVCSRTVVMYVFKDYTILGFDLLNDAFSAHKGWTDTL